MLAFRQRPRRRRSYIPPLAVLLLTMWYLVLLPADSPVVLAVHFNAWRAGRALGRLVWSDGDDAWLRGRPAGGRYPIHIPSEVGVVIKTGYGTRHRVREQLEAFAVEGGVLGDEGRDFLVVGDWSAAAVAARAGGDDDNDDDYDGGHASEDLGVSEVLDAVGLVMESPVGRALADHDRFAKYRRLRGAVDAGDEAGAEDLGRRYGWELDALKFIMAMELTYRRMPHKKWYMILDDDTFVVRASLQVLLENLDPSRPMYLGNSVGDYRARFAHGGSAVLVSGRAMRTLMAGRPDLVADAYERSLNETWGDRLVATTLQRIGLRIAEPYSRYFNGEPPPLTRIRPETACAPVVSFHGLREPGDMLRLATALAARRSTAAAAAPGPVLWGQLWDLFAGYPLETYAAEPRFTRPVDHVGPGDDDITTWRGVRTADECRRRCRRGCLAWSFYHAARECRTSPWLVPGSPAAADTGTVVSGVNWSAARSILRECPLAKRREG